MTRIFVLQEQLSFEQVYTMYQSNICSIEPNYKDNRVKNQWAAANTRMY